MTKNTSIIIKGARVNNLKNIDVEIPRNRLVVSPDYPAPANPHLHSIRFMPKGNAGTWRASAVTPVSFWDA